MIPVRENSEVVIMYPDILGKIRMILAPQALLQHHGVLPVLSCQLTQQNLGCAEVDIWCWPHLKKNLVKTLVNPLITGVITHLRAVGWATKLGFKHGKLENQLWKLGKTWDISYRNMGNPWSKMEALLRKWSINGGIVHCHGENYWRVVFFFVIDTFKGHYIKILVYSGWSATSCGHGQQTINACNHQWMNQGCHTSV